MDHFVGLIPLGGTVSFVFVTRNDSNTPTVPAADPTYRVYGPSGLMTSGTGTASQINTGSVTGATNASPIVITSAAHGLNTGTRITVASVGGNTAANGTFTITRVDADTFSLDGSTGNGAYTSGGTWKVTGLYLGSFTASSANGYEQGKVYTVVANFTVSSTAKAMQFSFVVV